MVHNDLTVFHFHFARIWWEHYDTPTTVTKYKNEQTHEICKKLELNAENRLERRRRGMKRTDIYLTHHDHHHDDNPTPSFHN